MPKPIREIGGVGPDQLTDAILTATRPIVLRGLPPEQRKAWQEVFRHYIFEADDETANHIPEAARHVLAPLTADGARPARPNTKKN